MLPLSHVRDDFYQLNSCRFAAGPTEDASLSRWRPGLRVSGVRNKWEVVSDGTEETTFAGCPWVPQWRNVPGYRLLQANHVLGCPFKTESVDAIFVGPLRINEGCAAPTELAVPESAFHDVYGAPRPTTSAFECRSDALFDAVRDGFTGIHFELSGGDESYFRPYRRLRRSEWNKLEHHVFTREKSTAVNVVPLAAPGAYFSFGAESIEELSENGIMARVWVAIPERNKCRLCADWFVVVDPEKAARYGDFLRLYEPGSLITVESDWDDGLDRVNVADLPALRTPPMHSQIFQQRGTPVFAHLPPESLSLTGERPVKVTREIDRLANDRWTYLLTSEALIESHLLPPRKAAAQYMDLHTVPGPFKAQVGGTTVPGTYYLKSDLDGLPRSSGRRKVTGERARRLEERFGAGLPPNWKRMSDEAIEKWAAYEQAKRDGWLLIADVGARIGVRRDYSWFRDHVRSALAAWMHKVGHGIHHEKDPAKDLFRPIAYEDVVGHQDFASLVGSIVGDARGFIGRMLTDDRARAAALLNAISG